MSDLDDLVLLEDQSFDGDRLSRAQYRRHLDSDSALVLVASANHRNFLSTAVVFFRRGSHVARLYSIASKPDARGKGVGAALLDAVEKQPHGSVAANRCDWKCAKTTPARSVCTNGSVTGTSATTPLLPGWHPRLALREIAGLNQSAAFHRSPCVSPFAAPFALSVASARSRRAWHPAQTESVPRA